MDFGMVAMLALLGAAGYGLLRLMAGKPSSARMVCRSCETVGAPKRQTRGSLAVEIALWLLLIVPGLIYSLWRLSSRRDVCPACGSPELVPADSPAGQRIASARR